MGLASVQSELLMQNDSVLGVVRVVNVSSSSTLQTGVEGGRREFIKSTT